jgi:RHS repeat-associated protein
MRRAVVVLLLLLASWRVEAGASATCPYYAINSTSNYACFQSLPEAEAFIRADPAGTRPTRRYLTLTRAVPAQVVSPTAISIDRFYAVTPRPGVTGAKGFKALSNTGAGTAYTQCGCDTSGVSAKCIGFGSTSNCTNQPDLCTYGNYCTATGSLSSAMVAYHSEQQCHTGVSVGFTGGPSASPLSFTNGVPDARPIYPPNTGTLKYSGTVNGAWVGGKMQTAWNDCNGQPAGGSELEMTVIAPLTCPAGFTVNPGTPPKVSEACTSGESGQIQEYRVAITNPTCSNEKIGEDGCYGNPVVASTGAKLQPPKGWNAQALLGLTLTYNSLNTDSTYGVFGGGWASLLSARFVGQSYNNYNYAYSDPEGNIETFWLSSNGVYRAQNSSQKFMRGTSPPCEWTVFEAGRRMVFSCATLDRRLVRVEYPEAPSQTLTVVWSTGEAFDSNGVQTVFNNVPSALVRADGRRLDVFYARINTGSDCDIAVRPYACNAVRVAALHDSDGNITLFDYNTDGRLALIYYPDGTRERFEYGAVADICPATMPGACTGTPAALLPSTLLTGTYIETPRQDGGFDAVRYGIYQYDNIGRAIVTTHPGDAGRTEFRYAADGTPTVRLYTDPSHYRDRKITSQRVNGLYDKPKTITETNPTGAVIRSAANTYDASLGYLSQSTDFRGVRTDWTFNDAGLVKQQVEAASDITGKRRTRQTDWNTTFRVPTEHRRYDSAAAVPGTLVSRATATYNARGQVTATCQIDPGNAAAMAYVCGSSANAPTGVAQTRVTRCEPADVTAGVCPLLGLVLAVDGARTDVADISTFTYYASDDASCASTPTSCPHHRGDLWKVTNALGQTTEFLRYDGVGRARSITDANGIVTDLEYSPRGWLTARKVRGADADSEVDDAITRVDYDAHGQVTQLTQPDGKLATFKYDAAHRLTDIDDALGNTIHYTLDLAGNPVQESTNDSSDVLKRSLSRLYDNLGQLQTVLDANAAPTSFTYDLNGNNDTVTDALNRTTDRDVDALNRVQQVIANTAGSASDRAVTQFGYDARDNLTAVVDPKGLTTSYVYNGLNRLTALASPDTGTNSFGYDAAGNRISQVDARGLGTSYSFDALNRLTAQAVPTAAQSVFFDYDAPLGDCLAGEMFGAGRLARIRDESGSTRYCYDRFGDPVRKVQSVQDGTTLTVGATYNATGRVLAMTYPSGAIVSYLRNSNGQITRIDAVPTDGAAQVTLVSNVTYLPFGPLTQLTFGNGRTLSKAYDQNYGIDAVSDSSAVGLSQDFTLNAVGNLTGLDERISAASTASRTYSYDGLDRLTAQTNNGSTVEGFAYDATGNRQSKTAGGASTGYSYASDSHRLTATGTATRSYDANGNTTDITGAASKQFVFNARNRLQELRTGSTLLASYRYNGKGERVLKLDAAIPGNSRQFVYDEAGHLLGEYTLAGARVKEYVWLNDALVAVLSDFDAGTYQYIETDHLGTPRAVVHPGSNAIIWRWDLNDTAFGEHLPNGNPDGDALSYELNLRFPGQYFDAESGIFYNYFRDYDAAAGRYLQPDPIGLEGGISAYGYVSGNPLTRTDTLGLQDDLLGYPRPPSFFSMTTFEAARRGTSPDEAVRRGALFRDVTAPALGIAMSPNAGALVCSAVPDVGIAVAACKHPILRALLGISVCSYYGSGGEMKSPRQWVRNRDDVAEAMEAAERSNRMRSYFGK